ncbi:TRAP transporter large permease [Halobacteria archaeon AArc-dxtr1]|nr:TRAP transporter large permease [Halobacteria archaeon AArc-dxtr1]
MIELGLGALLGLLTLLAFVLFVLGVPILLVFGVWVVGFHLMVPAFPMTNMAIEAQAELENFAYVAIPLFILVGDLIHEGDIAEDLIGFSRETIGWLPGSTGNTALSVSAIFSAITGSNTATTAAVGKALHPPMAEEGYDETYAAATVAAGGTVGAIIPPSILLIIYGVLFDVSIQALFLAGVIPGLAMVAGMIAVNSYLSSRTEYGVSSYDFDFSPSGIVRSGWQAKLGLGTIIILLGGIFAGYFTPSEASAVAVVYILGMGILARRIDSLDQVVRASFTSLLLVGVIMPVTVFAVLVQQNLSYLGLQTIVSDAILSIGPDWQVMLVMMVIMLITGSLLSSVPNIVLTAPFLTPAAMELGLDPVTWGVLFMMSDAIGFITPPYGLNLYVISGLTDIDYVKVAYAALPHLFVLIAIWAAFFVFPGLNVLAP